MKRKEKILEIALQMFNERGVSEVGVREIARALSISVGNLSYHFPKKEDIILALVNRLSSQNSQHYQHYHLQPASLNHFLQLLANIFSNQFDHRGILIGNAELKHIYSTIFDYQITLQKRVQGFELIYQNLQKANHLTLSEADLQHLISLTTLYARFWLHEAFIDHVSMSKNSLIEKYMKVWSYQLSIFATEEGKASLGEYWENVHE
ncbi:MAG: TetR/AcrR family transcriptional regulator [Bacteroidetes bacterium]|nr:TetR/AcrR family transcriptional regulator [Bacteroidota bacterium]